MSQFRKELADLLRPHLKKPPGFTQELCDDIDEILDRAGVPRDGPPSAASPAPAAPKPPVPASPAPASVPAGKLTVAALRTFLGLAAAGAFDAPARAALFARLSNKTPTPLTAADFASAASALGVSPKMVKAVREVEVAGDSFDTDGRPRILFERHIFHRKTGGAFDSSHPVISNRVAGGYGKFSAQYGKLGDACALDPDAAFQAASWGAFQVLGSNAVSLGYGSAFEMALALTASEAAHLDSFVRFVRVNKLVAALRACKPGDAASCVAFVRAYNGPNFAKNSYHTKLANAAL
jgi:N-acetylmuramidase